MRRPRSKAYSLRSFRKCIQGGGDSVSVWRLVIAEGVGSLAFYNGRLN